MQQIWITKAGPPEVLQIRETADPDPADNEVVIAVESAGINFADIMARLGVYQDAPDLPTVVGYEISGHVEKAGDNVTGFTEGDKVIGMSRFQGYSSKVALPEAQVFPLPKHWDFHQGA
ncbi:MAG: alcohol dehydrogenase catalytic domain-containing protein, partial [Candidatus Marinimicrobia bacterium]|nr:alcohol dehydrogenase catalytic domain-containing protein [Candidatus Neomarinimicrobiota bacterium]